MQPALIPFFYRWQENGSAVLGSVDPEGSPEITGLSPSSGSIGVIVTIEGANFADVQDGSYATIDGQTLIIVFWSDGTIKARIPAGAQSGDIVVIVDGVPSNAESFTVIPPDFSSVIGRSALNLISGLSM